MSMYQDDGESWSPDDGAMGVGMNGSVGEGPPPPEPDPGMRGGQLEQYGGVGGVASQLGGAIADAGNMTIQQSGQAFPGNAQRVMGAAVGDDKAQKIMAYLMGHDAADQETAKKFEQGVKHENPGINDSDANLLAVAEATKMGGPAAGWQMAQYNRGAYNAKASFAKSALNGIDGKAGDLQAAADAATQAGTHVLDGTSAIFTALPGGQGFTATVTIPGTSKKVSQTISPQQFADLMDIGKAGQYDRLMENGGYMMAIRKLAGDQGAYTANGPKSEEEAAQQPIPATDTMNPEATPTPGAPLPKEGAAEGTSISGTEKAAIAQKAADADQDDDQDDDEEEAKPGYHPGIPNPWDGQPGKGVRAQSLDAFPGRDMEFAGNGNRKFAGDQDAIPGTHDKDGHFLGGRAARPYGRDLENKSAEIFGPGNIGNERARQKFMFDQEQVEEERKNKIDTAGAGFKSKEEIARITAEGRNKAEETKGDYGVEKERVRGEARIAAAKERANAVLQDMLRKARNDEERNKIAKVRIVVNDPNSVFRKAGDIEDIFKKGGLTLGGPLLPEAPTPQAPTPGTDRPAPQQQSSGQVPPIKERVTGQVYKTPKGSFRWMGTGWQQE